MTIVVCLLSMDTTLRDKPTHPPGFWKVHRYAIEWCGLLIRGCFAKVKLECKHSYKQEKPNSLSLSLTHTHTHTHTLTLKTHWLSKLTLMDIPNPVTYLKYALIFQWYVIKKRGSKNLYQKDTCFKQIGLHAQNTITNIIEWIYPKLVTQMYMPITPCHCLAKLKLDILCIIGAPNHTQTPMTTSPTTTL
jgi:hypothetical protein